jgi:hypothetical protein
MPYGISQQQSDCSGWATVKQSGDAFETVSCHETKSDAVDQMVALSVGEDMEPMGNIDRRASEMNLSKSALRSMHKDKKKRNEDMSEAISEAIAILMEAQKQYSEEEEPEEPEEPEEMEDEMEEERQAPSLVAPTFMRASARRGLQLLEEGFSKVQEDGLKRQTVNDAQKMANGEALSPEKWRKISPWIARHMVDLEAVEDEPTAGLVAMLLWGGGATKASANRAKSYAEGIVAKLDTE